MTWKQLQVEYTNKASKELKRAGKPVSARIMQDVRDFARTGQGDVANLKGKDGGYRLRVGDWRVIFTLSGGKLVILRVSPRGAAYTKKGRRH